MMEPEVAKWMLNGWGRRCNYYHNRAHDIELFVLLSAFTWKGERNTGKREYQEL
jgi:hypothetical protein